MRYTEEGRRHTCRSSFGLISLGLGTHAVGAVTCFVCVCASCGWMYCVYWGSCPVLCACEYFQVFPSWSLERQAAENEKRKKAGGGHYFLMRFLTSSPFVLRVGTKETGREGGMEGRGEEKG